MKGSRGFRVVFGIIVLILFSFYTYKRISTSPHSNDFDSEHAFVYSEAVARLEEEARQAEALAAQQASMPAETPAPVEAPVPTEAPAETPEPVEEEYALPNFDLSSWELMLVNASSPLPADYAPPVIAEVSDSRCPVDSRIQPYLEAFLQGCRDAGLPVYLSSGYRSYDEQSYLFQRKLSQGYSYEGASTIVAPPGTSEHQTGLACDITDRYRESKSWEELEPTETFQWLNEHCAEYGFVLRYPKDKSGLAYDGSALQTVTGIIYEPWHFRYVGVEAATYIMSHGLALEEFIALYQN